MSPAPVDYRVEQIERHLAQLTEAVHGLDKTVAVVVSGMERIERDIATGAVERARIATEVGAFGIQMTKFVATYASLETAVNALKPTVTELSERQLEREGATKAATMAGKFVIGLWALLSGIAGAAITFFAARGRH